MIILYNNINDELVIVERNMVMSNLYYGNYRLPKVDDFKKIKDVEIISYTKKKTPEEIIEDIKKEISKIDNKIPLYDIKSKNLYLVDASDVYRQIMIENYRFPDVSLFNLLNDTKKNIENIAKKEFNISKPSEIKTKANIGIELKSEYNKLLLALSFLEYFDLNILEETFVKTFYYKSNEVGKNITICVRPSYISYYTHINPYYTRSELINLALNLDIIKPDKTEYTPDKIITLCNEVKKRDIHADVLRSHQTHIIDNDKIGIVQYYTLNGSFFINQYMRGFSPYNTRNVLLETIAKSMWELILSAPTFNGTYYLYRFIKDDAYLQDIEIGDVYTEKSFISTTRDPFYKSDEYQFGGILIRIKIPKNKKGIGLAVESVSNFPTEQEIILPPLTMLKLISKGRDVPYYHTDNTLVTKIKTRYDFELVGNKPVEFPSRPSAKVTHIVDFLELANNNDTKSLVSVAEKIKHFINKYTNEQRQFDTYIGSTKYTIITETYNSTSVYKKFYSLTTTNGFIMYTVINNYLAFTIEVGGDMSTSFISVNYYFRYSSTPKHGKINDEDFINFVAKVSHYFGIRLVKIYSEYNSCKFLCDVDQNNKNNVNRIIPYCIGTNMPQKIIDNTNYSNYRGKKIGGNFPVDIYKYLKSYKKKYHNINISYSELKPRFSYYELDKLRKLNPTTILQINDPDRIYQIYLKGYKGQTNYNDNIADFYIWMVENECTYISVVNNKIKRLYTKNMHENPFVNDYFVLDVITYLYNRNLIIYPDDLTNNNISTMYEQLDGFGEDDNFINTYRINVLRQSIDENNRAENNERESNR